VMAVQRPHDADPREHRLTVAARALRHGGRISDGWSAPAWIG
jgi:hypothetical protein